MPDLDLAEPFACVDAGRLEAAADGRAFRQAAPFPHLVLDGFLKPEAAEALLAEFHIPDDAAIRWRHFNERKRGLTRLELMGPATRAYIRDVASPRFLAWLERLAGVGPLVPDRDLDGAGLHETARGGFLNVHVDALSHTVNRTWSRQLNLLLYLNKDWRPEYNGLLELWDMERGACARRIEPAFNRCVLFRATRSSWHGYPAKLACPPENTRKSIAVYYYRRETAPLALEPTFYKPLPEDPPLKRALVVLDRWALRAYSAIKRRALITDGALSAFLRLFGRP